MNSSSKTNRIILWAIAAILVIAGIGLVVSSQSNRAVTATPAAVAIPQTDPTVEESDPSESTPTTPNPTALATLATAQATATATLTPTPSQPVMRVALPNPLPPELQDGILVWIAQQPGGRVVTDTQQADLWINTDPAGEEIVERVYVPVARFAALQEETSAADLLALWMGTPDGGQQPLVVDADTAAALTLLWGPAAQVEVLPDSAAVAAALEASPDRLGVLPFDRLVPQVKALTMNGQDPTNNDFDPAQYPLTLRFYLNNRPGFEKQAESLTTYLTGGALRTNRDPDKLTVLIMTGVTAMSRTTALRMEQKGYDYPAKEIGPILSKADLTHISNEVPFYPECQVDASENNLTLCSKPAYMESLRDVGVDLVGLTGNHMNDFGKEANLWSMQFYKDEGIPTYGGGPNLEESLKPLRIEHNGNRLALLGANSFGPEFAWAAEDWPGSAPYSLPAMTQAISDARKTLDVDLVLVELQWEESYDTLPIQSQIDGFRALSDAGADIVTGVQSHVPQAVEFRNGREILYGLGNLFFDQMWSQATREGLIPRQTIYDGRHLSTKLLTTVLEDFAQPRWASEAEREAILQRVNTASGW